VTLKPIFVPISEVMKFYEKVEGADTLRRCPICQGSGEFDVPSNMGPAVPKCGVCKGTGFVDLASTCACGMPAVLFKDDICYCGRDLCLNNLKHRRPVGLGC